MTEQMKYRVHVYAVVRVPFLVDADSPLAAAQKAGGVNLHEILDSSDEWEYAEEIVDFVVDEMDENGEFVQEVGHFKGQEVP